MASVDLGADVFVTVVVLDVDVAAIVVLGVVAVVATVDLDVVVVASVVVVVAAVVTPLHWNRLFFMHKETLRPRIFISARKLSGRLNKRHQMEVFC